MTSQEQAPKGTAVVAVNFDDQQEALVATAVSLARRFDLELRFVHTRLSQDELLAMDYSAGMYAYPFVVTQSEAEQSQAAAKNMDELLTQVPAGIRRSGTILTGMAVPVIAGEAVACRASLILTACDPDGYSAISSGMSTTVGLMHEAPLPVLAVNRAGPVDFAKDEFRLLLGDDLQQPTEEAARKAYELAARLGPRASVRHVHVHGDFRELLKNSWRESVAATRRRLPHKQAVPDSLEAAMAEEYEAREGLLRSAGQPWRAAAEAAGAVVTLDIRKGSVVTELSQASADFGPDLLVFGRHRLLRARPFLIGRLPFRAMLHEKRAVLVVPPARDLYARVPFPGA